ncbi:MAG TPA: hypothetical protein PKA20_04885 [Burkholderiaceae bacterium]|nr:hypothetical protein [Burkholderiaceae bacterium]
MSNADLIDRVALCGQTDIRLPERRIAVRGRQAAMEREVSWI